MSVRHSDQLSGEQRELLELMLQEEGQGSCRHSPPAGQSPWERPTDRAADLDIMTVVARLPGDVFAFATDLENSARWLKGLVKAEPLSSGPMRVGSRWRYTRAVGEYVGTVEVAVIQHEGPAEIGKPPYRHCGCTVNMGIEILCRYTFEAAGAAGTRVRMELYASAQNLAAKLMLPMVVKTVQELDKDQLGRLKRAIEHGD